MNRHHAAAIEGPDVRFAGFIERQIPADDASRPVAQDSRNGGGPMRPVRRVPGVVDVRSTLGPVHMLVRMSFMYARHGARLSHVAMPRHAVHILIHLWIIELRDGPSPEV